MGNGLSVRRTLEDRRRLRFPRHTPGPAGTVKFVNLAQDYGVFLLRFHLDDDGQHPDPHRWVGHEPDSRRDEDREDGAREEIPQADIPQRRTQDDLRRNRGCRKEGDEPQPLDPPIVDRRLGQVEQSVIPFDNPVAHRQRGVPFHRYKTLSG